MLKIKYKLISAAMSISLLLGTGVASVVHASSDTTSSQVVSSQSEESLTVKLDNMVTSGIINIYQEIKVFDAFDVDDNFNSGLDSLTTKGTISDYQASKILDAFNSCKYLQNK